MRERKKQRKLKRRRKQKKRNKMFLIIGLGNPGEEYSQTRHNLGYRVVELLAERWKVKFSRQGPAAVGKSKEGIILAQPLTYMNVSGQAVKYLLEKYPVSSENMLVISDDFSLPLGKLRIRLSGSSGGHRGLDSIIKSIGRQDFPRLRLGVGPMEEGGEASEYVLEKFKKGDLPQVKKMLELATEAVETILKDGWEKAMSKFNL